jgi:hypothetical protein
LKSKKVIERAKKNREKIKREGEKLLSFVVKIPRKIVEESKRKR